MDKDMNGYNLSRKWFDFCFENPDKISPIHTALYFFIIEHCNRLGWKQKFGLPTTMAMEALGIGSYNTYKKALLNIIEWGFLIMIESSKNQYSSNIVALSNFDKALYKALDKALIKHSTKQVQSTIQSIDSINKQANNRTIEQITVEQGHSSICIFDVEELISKNPIEFERICMAAKKNIQDARPGLRKYHLYLSEKEMYPKSKKALFAGFEKWLMNEKNFEHGNTKINGSDKHKGAKQLITLIKQNYAAGGTEDPSS